MINFKNEKKCFRNDVKILLSWSLGRAQVSRVTVTEGERPWQAEPSAVAGHLVRTPLGCHHTVISVGLNKIHTRPSPQKSQCREMISC